MMVMVGWSLLPAVLYISLLLFSVPGPQGTPTDGGFTMMMVMVGWS